MTQNSDLDFNPEFSSQFKMFITQKTYKVKKGKP